MKFLLGVGLAHQVLGRTAQAEGQLAEAERHLQEALRTLSAIGARFEVGRTHLFLASLAHVQERRELVAAYVSEARSLFLTLRAPKYLDRTEHLARELGVSLSKSGVL